MQVLTLELEKLWILKVVEFNSLNFRHLQTSHIQLSWSLQIIYNSGRERERFF